MPPGSPAWFCCPRRHPHDGVMSRRGDPPVRTESARSPQNVRRWPPSPIRSQRHNGRSTAELDAWPQVGEPAGWPSGGGCAGSNPAGGTFQNLLHVRISCTADLLVHARWYRRPSWVCPGHGGSDGEEATMTIPPDDDVSAPTKDDGTPVGTADAAEDARRAGADRDTNLRDPVVEGALRVDDENRPTDDGVPIGEADAEADRARAFGDDERP